ncbi:MAG: DUF6928 family protein [Candidatus Methylumidiphilus sp.]
MSGYGSIWVKINDPEIDLPNVRDGYNPNASLPEGAAFACAVKNADDAETPTEQMEELSQRFGEAIYMEVQTTVDFFIYSHWRDGELLREIQYSADAGWYDLQGEDEAWEKRLLSEEERQRQLSYLDLEHLATKPEWADELAEAQRTAETLEQVWAGQVLVEDSFYPMATASELYEIVSQTFGLASPYLP